MSIGGRGILFSGHPPGFRPSVNAYFALCDTSVLSEGGISSAGASLNEPPPQKPPPGPDGRNFPSIF